MSDEPIRLRAPGTPYGCCHACDHEGCKLVRVAAATVCPRCDEPCGFDRTLGVNAAGDLVHARCRLVALARLHPLVAALVTDAARVGRIA